MESLKIVLLTITTLCSMATFIFLIRSKQTKLSIYSQLKEIDGKVSVVISVTNESEKSIVINSIQFPLVIWDNEPRLELPKPLNLLRVWDDLSGSKPLTSYASDKVISYDRDPSKALIKDESIVATIPLDEMMKVILDAHESLFGSKFLNYCHFLLLNIQVLTSNGKCQKQKAIWEIRYYLASRYGRNDQLANISTTL